MTYWCVRFAGIGAVVVLAAGAESALISAQLTAWLATGRWHTPTGLQPIEPT